MSKKPSLLQTAMKASEKPEPTPAAEPLQVAQLDPKATPPSTAAKPAATYVAPSRASKSAKTHYLTKPYWETLEELSFRTRDDQGKRVPQEKLVAEALNLLFAKYNYPVVRDE